MNGDEVITRDDGDLITKEADDRLNWLWSTVGLVVVLLVHICD